MSRIDDEGRRILRVKFIMGLFENPMADYSMVDELGSQVQHEVSFLILLSHICIVSNLGELINQYRSIENWPGKL